MASLFQLAGSIFIDNAEANKSLSNTGKEAESVGSKLGSAVKKAGKFAAGVATAAVGAATALTSLASESASAMDVIDKGSKRMGISTDSYQELAHAASLSGVEMSTLERAAKALEGTDMNLDDAMNEIYSLGTETERSAKAAELFGDSVAYTLSPMLAATGEEMDSMKQEAHDLGLVMSEENVSAGATLNDALSNVKDSFSALVTGIGVELMPVVTEMCNFIIDNLPAIQDLFNQIAPVLKDLFKKIMPHIKSLIENLLPVLVDLFTSLMPVFVKLCEAILPIIAKILKALLPVFTKIVEKVLPVIAKLIEKLVPFLIKIVEAILPILEPLLDALLVILEPILELLNPLLEVIIALIEPFLEIIEDVLPPVTKLFSKFAKMIAEKVAPVIADFIKNFVSKIKTGFGTVKSKLEELKDKFKKIFEGIRDAVKTPINAVIGFINGLVGGVVSGVNKVVKAMNGLSFDVPDWVPGMGGKTFGFNIKELTYSPIPLLANGAVLEPNHPLLAVVGDQKKGTNIEAPLDTIKQAVSEVLAEMTLNVNVSASPDTAKWFSAMQAEGRAFNRRTGQPSMA